MSGSQGFPQIKTGTTPNVVFFPALQKGLKNVFDEAILAALEPPEPPKRRKCTLL